MATNSADRRDDKAMGVWQAPGHPLRIEYSSQVLEELRGASEDGFQKIPHGGIEIGALLLGTREPGLVRVLEWRPIECEHAKGPGFVLSDKDLSGLETLIDQCAHAPELRTLTPVGWFHTHTRSKIFLSPGDLAIHERFFPGPEGIALVMRLVKDQPPTAGFFVRDPDGSIQAAASLLEFTVNPDPASLLGPIRLTAARRGPTARRETRPPRAAEPAPAAESPRSPERETPSTPGPAGEEEISLEPPFSVLTAPSRRAWAKPVRYAGALAGVALVAAIAWNAAGLLPSKPETASLKLEEVDGQLEVRWDRDSRPIRAADRGTLLIEDGGKRRGVELTGEDVRRGAVFYTRTAEDLRVRLELFRGESMILQEMARFVGQGIPKVSSPAPGEPATPEAIREEALRIRKRVAEEIERGDDLKKQIRETDEKLRREAARR